MKSNTESNGTINEVIAAARLALSNQTVDIVVDKIKTAAVSPSLARALESSVQRATAGGIKAIFQYSTAGSVVP